MSQFGVYRNPVVQPIGYLLDIQSDLLAGMSTRVAIPLLPIGRMRIVIARLNPVFRVRGRLYAMVTQQITGLDRRQMGRFVASLEQERDRIIAAVDMMLTGI